jgi:hypothetical protein
LSPWAHPDPAAATKHHQSAARAHEGLKLWNSRDDKAAWATNKTPGETK